jgi:hypothetical protein
MPYDLPLRMRRNEDPLRLQFNVTEDGTPVDMTAGYSVRMQVRAYPGQAGTALLSLSGAATAAGSVINRNANGFELVIHKADVGAGTFPADLGERKPWVGAYDILVTEPGGDVTPWYAGSFTIDEGVTV